MQSSIATTCTPGQYCGQNGLPKPSGNCSAGFYCTSGAKETSPTDGTTGNTCPKGAYCLQGSITFTNCPPGTYSNVTENKALSDCQDCTKGWYCPGYGNHYPKAQCSPGYYCPPKQDKPNPFMCTLGHYCPLGSAEPLRCNSGYYQNEKGKPSCKV